MHRFIYITLVFFASLQSPTPGARAGEAPTRADLLPFSRWAAKYAQAADPAEKSRMLPDGVRLAKERQAVLKSLIESDPQQAVSSALSPRTMRALPRQVADQLETRITGIGDLGVVCSFPSQDLPLVEPMKRAVIINGVTYLVHVYGRRLSQNSAFGVPLRGVVVDGVMALDENVLRELGPGEVPDPSQEVIDASHSGARVNSAKPVLAEAGGKVFRFASQEQLRDAEALLERAENVVEPETDNPLGAVLKQALGLSNLGKSRAKAAIGVVEPVTVRVLVIRVDLPDIPGDPGYGRYSWWYLQDLMDNQIRPYYLKSSYGRVTLTNTVTPELFRMPNTGVDYATRLFEWRLHADAVSAASASGYNMGDYDRIIVVFPSLLRVPSTQIQFGGETFVGNPNVCVNGEADFRVIAHELGHTLGLRHANLWYTIDGDPVSDNGTNEGTAGAYNDPFDTMGGNFGNDSRTDFNPYYKKQLGWIDDTQVQTVTASGIYRVHRIDGPTATAVVALNVVKDDFRAYWVGCRRNFTENTSMLHGAYIIWAWPWSSEADTALIDCGNSGGNPWDAATQAALPLERTLIDPRANLSITVVGEGGDSPNEYIDVQISFGPPPTIASESTAQTVVAGETAVFTVQANGYPPPSYQWQVKPAGTAAWMPVSDDSNYAGSQTASLVVKGNTLAMSGDEFRCVLTNSSGGFNCTTPAVLNVLEIGVGTLAGEAGVAGHQDGVGTEAQFDSPYAVLVDSARNVLVADSRNSRIRKITPAGEVTTFDGASGALSNAEDVSSNAQFHYPVALALDLNGNLLVVNQGDSTISLVTPEGEVSTLAGLSGVHGSADGPVHLARFNHPTGIAVDRANNIYVADTGNHTIRRIGPDGTVVTIAGMPGQAGYTDGAGRQTRFNSPTGLACDQFGNVFVADQANCTIRKITPQGVVSTVAGLAGNPGTADGQGNNARLNYPAGIAIDEVGNLYVADRNNSTIRKITSSGEVTTLAGVAGVSGSVDGTLDIAEFTFPSGIAWDPQGLLYVADTFNNTIRVMHAPAESMPPVRINGGAHKVSPQTDQW